MKNERRIEQLEEQFRAFEAYVYASGHAAPVTYAMNMANTATPQPSFTVDAEGVATHRCADMLECAMLRYHYAYKVWQLYRDEVLMVAVDFCPWCGADFRNVTI